MAQIFFSKNRKSIASLLADGVHSGGKMVVDAWDSALVCPSLNCLDIDLTEGEVINSIRQAMTSLSSLDGVTRYFSIEVSSLPTSLQNLLNTNGRCTITESQLLSCVEWATNFSESSIPQKDAD